MPPSARRKDSGPTSEELRRVRDRELELKRMSGDISCSDCRRYHVRRASGEEQSPYVHWICADRGTGGTGYHVAIASLSNQHSHRIEQKLALFTERVCALEDALALESEARGGPGSHPLLAEDLLALKQLANADDDDGGSDEENYEEADQVLGTFGTLSIDESRTMRYIGPAGSESVLVMNNSFRHLPATGPTITATNGLSSDIMYLSEAFPFAPLSQTGTSTLSQLDTHLPPYERATALYEAFFRDLGWLMAPVERTQIVSEVVPVFYPSRKPISPSNVRIELAHDLALLFAVFACGSVGDLTQSPINDEAERFHALAKAAMGVRSIMHGASLAGVQTTYLLGSYDIYSGRKSNMEDAWKLFALGGSLATAIGLHRDPSRWGFEPKIVERRRRIFWEIYIIDIWRGLETGRPTIFRSNVVDCEFPNDHLATLAENGAIVESVAQFRYRFLRDVIVPFSVKMCSARSLKYRDILEIDRKIRDFPVHPLAIRNEIRPVNTLGIDAVFRRIYPRLTIWEKEESLLYIHRNLFARAIIDFPDNPLRSPFAASFLTTYRSAVGILRTCREYMEDMYLIVLRVWQLWSLCLTCGVVVGAVASLGASVSFATSTFVELEYAIALFEKYNEHRVARHGLPLLRQIRGKAIDALRHPRKCQTASDNNSFRSGNKEVGQELLILRGSTRVRLVEQHPMEQPTGNDISIPPDTGPGMTESSGLAHADPRFSSHDVLSSNMPQQPTAQNVYFNGSTDNGPFHGDPSHLSGSQYAPESDTWLAELENVLGTSVDLQQPTGATFDCTTNYSGPSSTPDVSSATMALELQGQLVGVDTLLPDTYLDEMVNTDDWISLMRQCGYSSVPPFSVNLDQSMPMMHGDYPMQSTRPMYE